MEHERGVGNCGLAWSRQRHSQRKHDVHKPSEEEIICTKTMDHTLSNDVAHTREYEQPRENAIVFCTIETILESILKCFSKYFDSNLFSWTDVSCQLLIERSGIQDQN